ADDQGRDRRVPVVERPRAGELEMNRIAAGPIGIAIVLTALAGTGARPSAAEDLSQKNLFVNSGLKSDGGGLPTGWQFGALPPCGSSFVARQSEKSDPEPGEVEIINDSPAESVFMQPLTLKPGWYQFTADINIETL